MLNRMNSDDQRRCAPGWGVVGRAGARWCPQRLGAGCGSHPHSLRGHMFCSELSTKGFQQLESPGVLGWVSEKLPMSPPRPLSWIQVLIGAPVCWRREEFGREPCTGYEPEAEALAVLMVQKRGVRCLKWRPPLLKERIESEGRAHPRRSQRKLLQRMARAEEGKGDRLEGGPCRAAPRVKCSKGHPLTEGD